MAFSHGMCMGQHLHSSVCVCVLFFINPHIVYIVCHHLPLSPHVIVLSSVGLTILYSLIFGTLIIQHPTKQGQAVL